MMAAVHAWAVEAAAIIKIASPMAIKDKEEDVSQPQPWRARKRTLTWMMRFRFRV